jgi:hypothetical protein
MALTLYVTPTATDVNLRAITDNPAAATIVTTRTMTGKSTVVRATPNLTDGVWAARDIEILFNTPIVYSSVLRDAAGNLLETADAAPVTVVNQSAYLRDVLVSSAKMPVRIVGKESGDTSTEVRRELLRPLGRKAPVVITDVRASLAGSTSVLTMTSGEMRQFNSLLETGRVLMFTGPADWDIYWPLYIHAGNAKVARVGEMLSEARLTTFEWVEVDPPPTGLFDPVEPQTWGQIVDAGTLWLDIRFVPWLNVMYPITRSLLRSA